MSHTDDVAAFADVIGAAKAIAVPAISTVAETMAAISRRPILRFIPLTPLPGATKMARQW